MRKILGVFTTAFAITAVFTCASAATFTNGDFESPDIGNAFYITYGDGSTSINGRTVSAPNGANVAIIGAGGGSNYPAESGAQWIDLTGTAGLNQGVTQSFDTNVSHTYEVSFWIGAAARDYSNGTSTVNVSLNGANFGSYAYTNTGTAVQWQKATFDFLSSAALSSLGFFNGDATGSLVGLDNVNVTDLGPVSAAPLLGALPFFATGISVFGLLGWRRKKKLYA